MSTKAKLGENLKRAVFEHVEIRLDKLADKPGYQYTHKDKYNTHTEYFKSLAQAERMWNSAREHYEKRRE